MEWGYCVEGGQRGTNWDNGNNINNKIYFFKMKKKRHWLQVKGTELAVGKDKVNSADQLFLTQTYQNDDQPENYISKIPKLCSIFRSTGGLV